MLRLLRPPILERNGSAMVRISEDVRKGVVFFGVRNAKKIEYGGTGFLVLETTRSGTGISYLVTARHVAESLDVDFLIRANLKNGGLEDIPIEQINWLYPDNPLIDIAVAQFSMPSQYDHYYYSIDDIPSPQEMVMCGDAIAIVGLFRLHFGSGRNIPIVHSGHVAALADQREPIPSRNTATKVVSPIVAHLVEAQTLDGLSGSPVFVQVYGHLTQFKIDTLDNVHPLVLATDKLFGIYHGSWDGLPGTILARDRNMSGGMRVPVGMGLVTPAEELISLIKNHPVLKTSRRELEDRELSSKAATADSSFIGDDGNPSHKEDFTSLLNAAVQKPKKDDGT